MDLTCLLPLPLNLGRSDKRAETSSRGGQTSTSPSHLLFTTSFDSPRRAPNPRAIHYIRSPDYIIFDHVTGRLDQHSRQSTRQQVPRLEDPRLPLPLHQPPRRNCALNFKTFGGIIADLNRDAYVDGDIEQTAAEELYYHFLLQYFPNDPQIPVLKRQFLNACGLDEQTTLILNRDGALIWPDTSSEMSRRTCSDDSHDSARLFIGGAGSRLMLTTIP